MKPFTKIVLSALVATVVTLLVFFVAKWFGMESPDAATAAFATTFAAFAFATTFAAFAFATAFATAAFTAFTATATAFTATAFTAFAFAFAFIATFAFTATATVVVAKDMKLKYWQVLIVSLIEVVVIFLTLYANM